MAKLCVQLLSIWGQKTIPLDTEDIDIDDIAYGADVLPTNDADDSNGNYEEEIMKMSMMRIVSRDIIPRTII
jgi:hypothetical protein